MKSTHRRNVKSRIQPLMHPASGHQGDIATDGRNQKILNLEYIFEMLTELRKIARKSNDETLAYFLEMAALEAGEMCDSLKFERDGEGH